MNASWPNIIGATVYSELFEGPGVVLEVNHETQRVAVRVKAGQRIVLLGELRPNPVS